MLKRALSANAAFSTASGFVLIFLRDLLAAEIPAPPWFFAAVGVGLLGFAAQLAVMASRPGLALRLAMPVVVSDAAWVVATSAALVVFFARISTLGAALIVAVNVVVGVLALLQYRGFAAERSSATPASGV